MLFHGLHQPEAEFVSGYISTEFVFPIRMLLLF